MSVFDEMMIEKDEKIAALTAELERVRGEQRPIEVAAAVIEQDGLVRIFKRGGNDSYTGKWEFPGGKAKNGESLPEALRRELQEELAVDSRIGEVLDHYWYQYPKRAPISLTFYAVKLLAAPDFLEHTESAWVRPDQLTNYDLMNGDMKFVATRYVQSAKLAAAEAARDEHIVGEALQRLNYDGMKQERDALREQVARLEADGKRLDWLDGQLREREGHPVMHWGINRMNGKLSLWGWGSGDTARKALDHAMEEASHEQTETATKEPSPK